MSVKAWSAVRRSIPIAGVTAALAFGGAAQAEDYRFHVDYRISLNGLPIGKATLGGVFDGPEYRLDGQGRLTGIAGALFDYSGSAAAAGRLRAGRIAPAAFSADATDGKERTSVRMTLVDDGVRRVNLKPALKPHQLNHPHRVKVTDEHTRNVMDPMSALIAPGGYDGQNFDRSVCDRSVPIFNGRERFDVRLRYQGIRNVEGASGGYSGPVLVCAARYWPVAGHRSDKDEITYVRDKVVFEVMLAPVAGSDLLVPYRASVSTMLGAGAIQATSITAKGALPSRSAALAD